ncbi:MAG: Gfo/Idh/MocA family oxidoreductase [Verrucomicrobia bacterium]|jgi:predicted dehydrogenase|nr:Gfo/Idh/MocA family oxidoreductase [Verrucomicrobiota bacterium]MBT4227217.1 Gfo/Idh/MocA family oxidoreductase [Verrucomicrobiota bacterium]MBT4623447.1 Gfo/Idh/MocA family oxidoreductase [Verrucomicrobiota bacterium]MBT6102552.1 Gfo/Idh/MocA family oxidoreductase [Verrucomicrobiota bacterium]MBT7910213.1 Gfo/Idh/MocA family oxidoreductase [Verrucomicrobiota bacterium]
MANDNINIGIVGLGFMAAMHIRAYREIDGVNVAAICDLDPERLKGDFTKALGNIDSGEPVILDMSQVKAYQDFKELLADDSIDAIDICTPTRTHLFMAKPALASGKHVICEKPLARNIADATELVEAAEQAKGQFMVGMCLRFWPQWAWLKEAVVSGRYGKVQAAHFQRIAEPPAWGQAIYFDGKTSGGALFDLHVHDTDFVQHVFGRPKSVYSTGFTKVSGAIDHVLTQYEVECGAKVSAEGSWAMTPGWGFNMSYRVIFERATADYDVGREDEPLRLFEEGKEKQVIECAGTDGYAGELAHFIDSIRSGKTPSVSAAEGLCTVEICAAEEQSVLTGQSVKLD